MLNKVGFNVTPQRQRNSMGFGVSTEKFRRLTEAKGLAVVINPASPTNFGTLVKIVGEGENKVQKPIKTGINETDLDFVYHAGPTEESIYNGLAKLVKKGYSLFEEVAGKWQKI